MSFTETDLFRRALGQDDPQRQRLVHALERFRERAATLAGEIHRDLPEFTVHDITHIDALWEMADLIAGPEYPLTPLEAFALGGVFLLHDLGLGLAAWPGGPNEIKQGDGWKDTLSAHLRKHLDRVPTEEELANPPHEIERAAIQERLRVLHAERAEALATVSFKDPHGGATYYLIEDADLRHTLGPLLGKIAHSHWWPVSRLGNELDPVMGALPNYPRDWTLDPLKVAVLLRTADAAHLDARRAPGFLRALRRPEVFSREHWMFQEHLLKPQLRDDRLTFTTARPFPPEEADSWWLCYETLQMVDRELHQVDALLADLNRSRLVAHGVAGVESPLRLQNYIKVSGWRPVDARIHVSNVADLVKRLGGDQLYGKNQTVPLRELIQNAADAVRARRIVEDRPENWGRITVRLGEDVYGPWIEVEDNGIGMSEAVLSGPLLNFGTTYWGSSLMREEHEGLWAKGFIPTGQFGIGFFSVFMWGHRVRVTTRRYGDAQRDARVLEFQTGLQARPLLRSAKPEERLRDGTTCVRVWQSQASPNRETPKEFAAFCATVAPALDVDLYVEGEGSSYLSVAANDWLTLDGRELFLRLGWIWANPAASRLRIIQDSNGRIFGRAAISGFGDGVVVVGGLRAASSKRAMGVFLGAAANAARDKAVYLADRALLASWASEQAILIANGKFDLRHKLDCSEGVLAYGGNPGSLPIAERTGVPLNSAALSAWGDIPEEVCVYESLTEKTVDFDTDVLVIPYLRVEEEKPFVKYIKTALAEAWDCSYDDIEESNDLREIGVVVSGEPFEESVVVLYRKLSP